MTKNSRAKQRRRALKQQRGISYLEAHRLLEPEAPSPAQVHERSGGGAPTAVAAGTASVTVGGPPDPDGLTGVLYTAADDWSSRQVGQELDDVWPGFDQTSSLSRLESPEIHELIVRPSTVDFEVDEEYEGGTLSTKFVIAADLSVEGLLYKSDALGAADSDTAVMLDFDHNDHFSRVVAVPPIRVELEFDATVSPDTQTLHDLQLLGIRPVEGS